MKDQLLQIQLKVSAILLLGAIWGGITVWNFLNHANAFILLLIIPVLCIAGTLMAQITFLAKLGQFLKNRINQGDNEIRIVRSTRDLN